MTQGTQRAEKGRWLVYEGVGGGGLNQKRKREGKECFISYYFN